GYPGATVSSARSDPARSEPSTVRPSRPEAVAGTTGGVATAANAAAATRAVAAVTISAADRRRSRSVLHSTTARWRDRVRHHSAVKAANSSVLTTTSRPKAVSTRAFRFGTSAPARTA